MNFFSICNDIFTLIHDRYLLSTRSSYFTVLKDTESLDVVVRHQPEKQILGGGPGSEIARRSRGKKFVIQHITGGNGNADGLLDNSVCGAASQCCIIQFIHIHNCIYIFFIIL